VSLDRALGENTFPDFPWKVSELMEQELNVVIHFTVPRRSLDYSATALPRENLHAEAAGATWSVVLSDLRLNASGNGAQMMHPKWGYNLAISKRRSRDEVFVSD
jgi:hypothetical protein